MDFRKLNQTADEEIILTMKGQDYICKNKIDPSTCSIVIGFGGIHGCAKCKNFIRHNTVDTSLNGLKQTDKINII